MIMVFRVPMCTFGMLYFVEARDLMTADLELGSPLVQRHGMPEITRLVTWRRAQRQLPGYKAHAGHAVEASQKVDRNIDAEGGLEVSAVFPTLGRVVGVEFVGKGNLLKIARRQEANLVDHAR